MESCPIFVLRYSYNYSLLSCRYLFVHTKLDLQSVCLQPHCVFMICIIIKNLALMQFLEIINFLEQSTVDFQNSYLFAICGEERSLSMNNDVLQGLSLPFC